MNDAYLLTGGNRGDRLSFLTRAKQAIQQQCGEVLQASSIYETAAWGKEDQEAFLNQVLHIRTVLTAEALLEKILSIEKDMGRERDLRYGPRFIDIDILFFNEEVIDIPGLRIPHPQMQHRRFVLTPLAEIAAGKMHPLLLQDVSALLAACTDPLAVNKIY